MAEDLSEYLHEQGVKVRYLHSDIDTLERIEIIRDLRLGKFDVLVGINLLREGLDIPECGLVAILDADKEGYLRSETSLVQTIGRAARNVDGRCILYADTMTKSLRGGDRRDRPAADQAARLQRGATASRPTTIKRNIQDILKSAAEADYVTVDIGEDAPATLSGMDLQAYIGELEKKMRDAAADLEFEEAARLRDEIKRLEDGELGLPATADAPGSGGQGRLQALEADRPREPRSAAPRKPRNAPAAGAARAPSRRCRLRHILIGRDQAADVLAPFRILAASFAAYGLCRRKKINLGGYFC